MIIKYLLISILLFPSTILPQKFTYIKQLDRLKISYTEFFKEAEFAINFINKANDLDTTELKKFKVNFTVYGSNGNITFEELNFDKIEKLVPQTSNDIWFTYPENIPSDFDITDSVVNIIGKPYGFTSKNIFSLEINFNDNNRSIIVTGFSSELSEALVDVLYKHFEEYEFFFVNGRFIILVVMMLLLSFFTISKKENTVIIHISEKESWLLRVPVIVIFYLLVDPFSSNFKIYLPTQSPFEHYKQEIYFILNTSVALLIIIFSPEIITFARKTTRLFKK